MPMITVSAHFDGEKIQIDEPLDMEPNAKLIVTILPKAVTDTEYESWLMLSRQKLQEAYGDDEPDYAINLLREENPHYEGR